MSFELPMPIGEYFEVSGDEATTTIWYPRSEADGPGACAFTKVRVDLMDVRAADPLRVSYDFDRDGWRVEQQSVFEWSEDAEKFDPEWVEVGFFKAWGSQRVPDPESET